MSGSTLYAGGSFGTISGQARVGIAALSTTTGNANLWNPSAGSSVLAIALNDTNLYVGGQFLTMEGENHPHLAGIGQSAPVVGVGGPLPRSGAIALATRPNPFQDSVSLGFVLPHATEVSLKVFDLAGREVARLADRKLYGPGSHEVRFERRGLSSGVYLCLLEAGGQSVSRRIVLIP
ncbi:MAG: T9SS type A sorting domain-containing protein [Candidatus Eisenbacteria bacterium]|uniref:T9SS type A sorting domain-containing protein n=1 Tax=Eiseniibacteriota bacterium TaxID=2212470 RepID=A0A538U6L8_UNCEI|nr:MAG: T9SS type A sorting domain-containing protein [Candidatus Eisenbacteria bacterium]